MGVGERCDSVGWVGSGTVVRVGCESGLCVGGGREWRSDVCWGTLKQCDKQLLRVVNEQRDSRRSDESALCSVER